MVMPAPEACIFYLLEHVVVGYKKVHWGGTAPSQLMGVDFKAYLLDLVQRLFLENAREGVPFTILYVNL